MGNTKSRHFKASPKLKKTIKASNSSPKTLIEQIEVVSVLGKGSFGEVSHVLLDGQSLALKTMSKSRFLKENGTNNAYLAWNERDLSIACDSPFVLNLLGAGQTDSDLLMLSPFCGGGDLLTRLKEVHYSNLKMSQYEVAFCLAQLILALEHLQSMKICHRDIKPDNIFITSDGNCVLGDMGLATQINDSDKSRKWGKCGSYGYRAPEVVRNESCGYASDIYSLGITIYFYAFGGVPWSETQKRLFEENRSNKTSLFFPKGTKIQAPLCDLLAQMLEVKMENRITVKEMKEHPALSWIDWDKLAAGKLKAPFKPVVKPSLVTLKKKAQKFAKKKAGAKKEASMPLTEKQQANFRDFEFLAGEQDNLRNPGNASRTASASSESLSLEAPTPEQQFRQLGVARSPFTTTRSLTKQPDNDPSAAFTMLQQLKLKQ